MSKRCARCGQVKSPAHFHKEPRKSDGLKSWCKACVRETSKLARRGRSRGEYAPDPKYAYAEQTATFVNTRQQLTCSCSAGIYNVPDYLLDACVWTCHRCGKDVPKIMTTKQASEALKLAAMGRTGSKRHPRTVVENNVSAAKIRQLRRLVESAV